MNAPLRVQSAAKAGPRGFIVTRVNQADYSPARVFVEDFVVIGGPDLSPNGQADWQQPAIHHIRKILANYVPGIDFIIPTGSPSRMVLVGMVLREKGKRHRLLGWDGRTSRYFEYDLHL